MRTKVLVMLALVLSALTLPASASPAARRAAAFARWDATRVRLMQHLPLDPALRAPSEPGEDAATLFAAGDLDGDGATDLVDVRQHLTWDDTTDLPAGTAKLEAHRGRDGAQLWSASLGSATYAYAFAAKVGTNGANGILAITYNDESEFAFVAGAFVGTVTISAYDGSGTQLWTRPFTGEYAFSLVSGTDTYPYVSGVFDAVAGGGDDLLVVVPQSAYAAAFVAGASGSDAQLLVVDGANGVPRPLGAPLAGNADNVEAAPVPDLDGDRLDDAVVTTAVANTTRAVAVSGATGKPIWTAGLPDSENSWPDSFGDVTGDGVADVVVSHLPWSALPLASSPGERSSLVDGKTGTVLWTEPGTYAYHVGHGLVGTVTSSWDEDTMGLTIAAYDAAGHARWTVRRAVRLPETGMSFSSVAYAGDIEADGYGDVGYTLSTAPMHGTGTYDGGTVSGRTGRVVRDPVKDLYIVRAALDGHGDDSFTRTVENGVVTVTTWRGDGSRKLWRTSLAGSGSPSDSFGAPLDSDRCADFVLALVSGNTTVSYAFSGRTGLPLWSLTRAGQGDAVVGHPAVKKHAVTTKVAC